MIRLTESAANQKVFLQIDQLEQRSERGIRQGFFKLGSRLTQELRQELLKKNKRGRVYIRKDRAGRRRRHRASAAGQTPANRTGNYRKNVGYQIRGSQQLEFGVRNGAEYAKFLEDGTSRMAARPGIGNAVKATARDARSFFDSSLERELTVL